MKITYSLIVTMFALLIFGSLAWGVEIFYPADKTYVRRANYLIVNGGEPQLEAVVLAFNGLRSAPINVGDPNYRRVFGSLLIIPAPPFEVGQNEIVVEGYVAGKLVRSANATIYYQPDFTEPSPEGFEPFVMHLSEREAQCGGCHVMEADAAQMSISDPAQNPCVSCHKGMLRDKYVHGPVGSLSCGDCHIVAKSGQKYPVRERGAALCNECHDDKTEEFARNKFVHGPVAAGMCEVCHDVHGSANPAQLVFSGNALCISCHEQVNADMHVLRGVAGSGHPVEGKKNPANEDKPFGCVSCHNPHGGASKVFWPNGITSKFRLCGHCHDK